MAPGYHQAISVESGVGYGVVGADMHVFADGVPVYLLANWRGTEQVDPSWLREMPSRMLNARFAVVGFTGRQEELAQLHEWRQGGPRLTVRWLYAPGGTGKTRLAALFGAESAAGNWKVVTAIRGPGTILPELPSQDLRPGDADGLLLIVDYADQWPLTHLATLLSNRLFAQSEIRTRVLLLARTEDAWERVRGQIAAEPHAASSQYLGPLPASLARREEMFIAARDSFGRRYGLADASGLGSPVPLDHHDLGLTLAVHVAALVAVHAHVEERPVPADPSSLTAYLLDREHDHWQHLYGDNTHELNPAERTFTTAPDVMSRVVFAAALTGPVPESAGIGALRELDDIPDPEPTLADHAHCYPPEDRTGGLVLAPLYPDRLAEDFLALTIPGHKADFPDKAWAAETGDALLVRSSAGDAAMWTPRAIIFLAAAAERWDHVGPRYLFPLLNGDPRLAVDAGSAALSALAHLADVPVDVIEAIGKELPAHSDPDLDTGAAAIMQRLAPHQLARTDTPQERAWLYDLLASRLSWAGLRAQALDAAREGVTICRSLAAAEPRQFTQALAVNVAKLGKYLADMGQLKQARQAAIEAATLWKTLADADPDTYGPHLASSLQDLGHSMADAGRLGEARSAAEKAVAIWRRLVEKNSVAHRQGLADSLLSVAAHYADEGKWAPAAASSGEAVGIYRELFAQSAVTAEPTLALALNNLSGHLAELGEHAQALAAAREAVAIRRRLAKVNRAAFEPGLVSSLDKLASCLADQGSAEDALIAEEEALTIIRRLAEQTPAAFDPEFAFILHNIGFHLANLGRHEEALVASKQSAQTWRRLASGDPAAYSHRLAQSLATLASDLAELGRDAEALATSEEGIALLRSASEANPETFARALADLGGYLARQGQPERALAITEEAVDIYRALDDAYPAAHSANYAVSLSKLGLRYSELGHTAKAADALRHSAALYRRLAAENPAMFEPELVFVLRQLAPELDRSRLHAEAADADQEAVALLRRRAANDKTLWERELASALSDLSVDRLMQGHTKEAVTLAEEAVTMFRMLAEKDPAASRAGLARARRALRAAQVRRMISRS
jgi:Tetratricopeptide repeat